MTVLHMLHMHSSNACYVEFYCPLPKSSAFCHSVLDKSMLMQVMKVQDEVQA